MNPFLIDTIVSNYCDSKVLIDFRWYISKPYSSCLTSLPLLVRLYHAWLVIRNKAYVFQFKENQIKA